MHYWPMAFNPTAIASKPSRWPRRAPIAGLRPANGRAGHKKAVYATRVGRTTLNARPPLVAVRPTPVHFAGRRARAALAIEEQRAHQNHRAHRGQPADEKAGED